MTEELRKLAEAADEGYSGAHLRDSNNWKANEAFCRACSPKRILKLLDVADKARAVCNSTYSGPFDLVFDLRSALAALEK
ncbi:MAG: hypothetical protein H0X13_15555 [Ramlibacter sp.]|nr:hypothetical protein [Ramlibacter sp.]